MKDRGRRGRLGTVGMDQDDRGEDMSERRYGVFASRYRRTSEGREYS